ncbi:hypothetical protein ACP4OV_011952 [Aristida adscensionis]
MARLQPSGVTEQMATFPLLLLLASLLVALPMGGAQPWPDCGDSGSYTANSRYQSNLSHLSATLPGNASRTLFAEAAAGTAAGEIVYALALCRGDTNASTCESCVANAFQEAQRHCVLFKAAAIFYNECNVHYSDDHNFLAPTNYGNRPFLLLSQENVIGSPPVPVVKLFDAAVAVLLNATCNYAATNSSRRFATGEKGRLDSSSIYGLAQCTPDLSPAHCQSCLQELMAFKLSFHLRLSGRRSVGIFQLRCNFRYELDKFFTGEPMLRLQLPLPPAPTPNNSTPTASTGVLAGGRTRNKRRTVLAIALPLVAIMLAVTMSCLCFLRKRMPVKERVSSYSANLRPQDVDIFHSLLLDMATLCDATDNFAENNKIGEGGFGAVYKGVLPDGREIAVKRLSQSSGQGMQELKNELVLVAKLQHKNLVRLVGICLQDHEKLLVYEYMLMRSIDTILFDPERSKELDWGKRFKIISGIARGLRYLHEDSQFKIIHRDLKASNVLLDSDYTPKISDFGLARLFSGDHDQSQEVTNRVVGTYGYMAPEYAMCGQYSIKSDVFSFGVFILEIITGRRSNGSYHLEESVDLLSLVWEHWTSGTIAEIMDSSLRGNAPGDLIQKCVHIGLLCVQDNPADRTLMSTVNVMLSSTTICLQSPLKPMFFIPESGTYSNVYLGSHPTALQSQSPVMSSSEVSVTEV